MKNLIFEIGKTKRFAYWGKTILFTLFAAPL
jgi:hypothetical protein